MQPRGKDNHSGFNKKNLQRNCGHIVICDLSLPIWIESYTIHYSKCDPKLMSNAEIGEQFGLTYSYVARRGDVLKHRLENEDELKGQSEVLKSQIAVKANLLVC